MKVLIAEDSSTWRILLENQIQKWGYEPVLAKDGEEAWAILQREDAPRLALLDWQMPKMDGIEVCRNLKRSQAHHFTYVILLTGRDAQDDMVAGLEAGADDYLTKPIEMPILRSRLMVARRIVEVVPPKEWSKPQVPGYEVERLLGKGAFATVWEAIREQTKEAVALKIIRVDLATEEVFGRFAREIRLMQQMDHPNIARVYESRIDQDLGYYAMELVPGMTLEKHVHNQRPKAGKILLLMAKVCDALEHVHQHGIIHRDLKPTNIMVTEDGQPKLVDFGLAKSLFHRDPETETTETLVDSAVGTPLFMAPEQARGENDQLDARTDIYALGILLYLLCVRRHPHKVNKEDRWQTIQEMAKGRARPPREVKPDFDPELELIIMKALAEAPEDRFQTAGAFAQALRDFLRGRVVQKAE